LSSPCASASLLLKAEGKNKKKKKQSGGINYCWGVVMSGEDG